MADIFLSYSNKDVARATKVVEALTGLDYDVFWDQQIPLGENWDEFIRRNLKDSQILLALWSKNSTGSDNVIHEVLVARAEAKYMAAMLDELQPSDFPMSTYVDQMANLREWDGSREHPEFQRLFQALRDRIGPPMATTRRAGLLQGRLSAALAENEGLQKRIAELASEKASAAEQARQAGGELARLKSDLAEATETASQAQKAARENDRLAGMARELEGQLARSKQQIQKLQEQLESRPQPTTVRQAPANANQVWSVAGFALAVGVLAGVWGGGLFRSEPAAQTKTAAKQNAPGKQQSPQQADPAALLATPGKRGASVTPVTIVNGAAVHAGTPAGTVFKDCPACPEMVVLPLNNSVSDPNSPDFAGALTAPIAISRFELTEREYFAATGVRPDNRGQWPLQSGVLPETDLPQQLNRNQAIAVAANLSKSTGMIYRLPTFDEWRFAAAAGNPVIWRGELPADIACKSANLADVSTTYGQRSLNCNDRSGETATPVGTYLPNRFGLYDMFGNVLEWVEDRQSGFGGGYQSGLLGPWLAREVGGNSGNGDYTSRRYDKSDWFLAEPDSFGARLVRVLSPKP